LTKPLVGAVADQVEPVEGGGIGWVLVRVILNPLKEPIDHAQVVVKVWVEGGAEAMQEAHGADGGLGRSGGHR